jgi:AraC family transcriptional regulator of adaptative response/methylated-DNA-[protein]-cysteine methyltransferase
MSMNDDPRWSAVAARDRRADGAFVFAVTSTGIYCKPSCPSRRPAPERVRFFDQPDAAEREGFRACRRCRPRAADPAVAAVARACRAIDESDEPLSLDRLAAETGVAATALHRAFKRVMGVTPRQYAEARRVERFKTTVKGGSGVTGALYEAGYGSSSRLYEKSNDRLGMTPDRYRRGGRGMRLAFTTVGSPLGRLLVAATERGISAVTLGDDDGALEAALHEEYPAAEIRRAAPDEPLGAWVEAIVEHLEGSRPHLDLPLDLQATAFQARVWEELRKIPFGETRTYSEVAAAIGRPTAARAVARACATNPTALVTPCHRVVRSGGDPSGYRWGVDRKRALLAGERARSVCQDVREET